MATFLVNVIQSLCAFTVVLTSNVCCAVLLPNVANVVAVINTSVKFSCTTSTLQQVRWKHYTPDSNNPTLLYNGFNIPPSIDPRYDFVFHPKSGQNDLKIDQIRQDDSGSFECLELTTTQRATFQLVVLAAEPVCLSNVTGTGYVVSESESIVISCDVEFSGNLSPVLTCLTDSPGQVVIIDRRQAFFRLVSYQKVLPVSVGLDNKRLSCGISFTNLVNTSSERQNRSCKTFTPTDFSFNWTSPRIHVISSGHSNETVSNYAQTTETRPIETKSTSTRESSMVVTVLTLAATVGSIVILTSLVTAAILIARKHRAVIDSEVHSADTTTPQPVDGDSHREGAVHAEENLALRSVPSTLDVYAATTVYWEITDNIHEVPPPQATDEHTDHSEYEALDAQSVEPQRPLATVPVYISLLSGSEVQETEMGLADRSLEVACVTEMIQLPISSNSETQQV